MPIVAVVIAAAPAMVISIVPAPIVVTPPIVVAATIVAAAVIHRAVRRVRVVVDRCRTVVIARVARIVIAGVTGVIRRRVIRRRVIRAAVVAVDAVVVADVVARPVEAQADADVAARKGGWRRDGTGDQQARGNQTAMENSGIHGCLRSVGASTPSSGAGDESVLSAKRVSGANFVQLRGFKSQQPCMFGRRAKSGGIPARVMSSTAKRSLREPSSLNRRALLENTMAPSGASRSAQASSSAA